MLSTMDGAPRGAALWCAMSPARMTSAGRRLVELADGIDELAELAEATRPGWNAKSDRLKAVGLASILMEKLAWLPLNLWCPLVLATGLTIYSHPPPLQRFWLLFGILCDGMEGRLSCPHEFGRSKL